MLREVLLSSGSLDMADERRLLDHRGKCKD